jgi:hypothetical protein
MCSLSCSNARKPGAGSWTMALVAAGLAFLATWAHGAATEPLGYPNIVARFEPPGAHFAGVDSRHRVYFTGAFSSVDGVPASYLARFFGGVDQTWKPAINPPANWGDAILLEDPSGRLVLAMDKSLYRIDRDDGSRTEHLGTCGFGVAALAVDSGRGDIYFACRAAGTYGSDTAVHIFRILESGEKDPLFDVAVEAEDPYVPFTPGIRQYAQVDAIAHDGGQYLYVTGLLRVSDSRVPSRKTYGLARIDTISRTLDETWLPLDGRSEAALGGFGTAIALAPPNWVYAVVEHRLRGRFSLRGDGPIDPDWSPAVDVVCNTIALDPARPRVYVDATLRDATGFPFRPGLAAFSTTPGAALDLAWEPREPGYIHSMRIVDNLLFVANDQILFPSSSPRRYVAALRVAAQPLVDSPIPRLANLSTRGYAGTGDDVLISGFVVGGTKTVMVTATGPSLAHAGVGKPLANPTLTLVRMSDRSLVAFNDDWERAINADQVRASGLAPAHAFESAIMAILKPGAYTAIVSGADGGTGEAVVAVYEMNYPQVRLTSMATRARVASGDDAIIGGFMVLGFDPLTVLISAVGPSLTQAGIEHPLDDPKLTLVRSSDGAIIAFNNNWVVAPNAAAIAASGLAPADPYEPAILVTLAPGAYTAIVTLASGDGGTGMVQIFAQ